MLKIYRRAIKFFITNDGKALIENFASLGLVQFASNTLPLITLPYLTRVIGVEKFGALSMATAIIMYFQTFIDFGFDYTSTKEIAKNRENRVLISEIFGTTMAAKLVLLLIAFITLALLTMLVPYINDNRLLIWLTFLLLPGYYLFPTWFFQGMEKMKFLAVLNLISKLIFTILVFVVIKQETDYYYYPVLTALGLLLSGLAALYIIFRFFAVKVYIPSWRQILKAYNSSYDVFLNLLFPNFYNGLSTILLGAFHGEFFVGFFSAAKRFVTITQSMLQLFAKTFFPYLARNISKHGTYSKMVFILSLIVSVILFTFATPLIHLLFGRKFEDAILILRIMSFAPVFLQLMNAYGTNYLILVDKAKLLRQITMYSSVFGLIVTVLLTYKFKAVGASISIMATWCLRGVLSYYFAQNIKKNLLNNSDLESYSNSN